MVSQAVGKGGDAAEGDGDGSGSDKETHVSDASSRLTASWPGSALGPARKARKQAWTEQLGMKFLLAEDFYRAGSIASAEAGGPQVSERGVQVPTARPLRLAVAADE